MYPYKACSCIPMIPSQKAKKAPMPPNLGNTRTISTLKSIDDSLEYHK